MKEGRKEGRQGASETNPVGLLSIGVRNIGSSQLEQVKT
jgi:hypothetical protein